MRRSQSFLEIEWSNNHEVIPKDDHEVFSFQHQLPPLDLSVYDSMSIHQDNLDDAYLMDIMSNNPVSSSMNILPDAILYEDGFMIEKFSEFGFQDQEMLMMKYSFGLPNQETYMMNSLGFPNQETCMINSLGFPYQTQEEIKDTKNVKNEENMKMVIYGCQEPRKDDENKVVDIDSTRRALLSMEVLRKYFYLPITQAARELNVGLTLLKKICRDLGFGRWPHRKLMSIQALIANVQELRKSSGDEEAEEVIRLLEEEKMKIEENPDLPLKHVTKRLRQSCFKANYKKRKTMAMTAGISPLTNNSSKSSSVSLQSSSSSSTCVNDHGSYEDDDDYCADEEQEKVKAILFTDHYSPISSKL